MKYCKDCKFLKVGWFDPICVHKTALYVKDKVTGKIEYFSCEIQRKYVCGEKAFFFEPYISQWIKLKNLIMKRSKNYKKK